MAAAEAAWATMPIRFTCACKKKLKAGDDLAGKKVRCPACGRLLTVPRSGNPATLPVDDLAYSIFDKADAKSSVQAEPLRPDCGLKGSEQIPLSVAEASAPSGASAGKDISEAPTSSNVEAIGSAQKLLIMAILASILAMIFPLLWPLAAMFRIYCVCKLSRAMGFTRSATVCYVVISSIPIVDWVCLLLLNDKATSAIDDKYRPGCITVWFIWMIYINIIVLTGTVIDRSFSQRHTMALAWGLRVATILNIIWALAILNWKKWGFYGFCASCFVGACLNLHVGNGVVMASLSFLGILVQYSILQAGGIRNAWNQLE
jgi:hypothetical protein